MATMEMEMQAFIEAHNDQFMLLNIPEIFFESIYTQCLALDSRQEIPSSDVGSILVLAHLCSWNMVQDSQRGLLDGLATLSTDTLISVYQGLCAFSSTLMNDDSVEHNNNDDFYNNNNNNNDSLLEAIYRHPRLWTCVLLYRNAEGHVQGALPAPPYYSPLLVATEADTVEAQLTGPFAFRYHSTEHGSIINCSLLYVDPNYDSNHASSLTIDYVPLYSIPSKNHALMRSIRYAALLEHQAPNFALHAVKEIHATFVQKMHLVRQQQLEQLDKVLPMTDLDSPPAYKPIYTVFTDTNDPIQLGHPDAGLSKEIFQLVNNIHDADIIYSYKSLFAPGSLRDEIAKRDNVLVNQFPYEGAFVQKDHLGREILLKYGLPRPPWALETYDLDCQLGEFIGAALLDQENAIWIIKPASGTQSKGHVVTQSLPQVLRLIDAGGPSRVAQRYIQHPVCYQGRKVDCRCIVMMTPHSLYMHKRVYFRIAAKEHSIQRALDLVDHERVLSAMHLVDLNNPQVEHTDRTLLPIDFLTIAKLEQDYGDAGFTWESIILPKIHTLIKELFNGMKQAYPAMSASSKSRAVYGVDVMFEVGKDGIEPKLTEVTFCPANNAICDAYQRDEDLYRNYNTDIFKCAFLGQVSDSVVYLQ